MKYFVVWSQHGVYRAEQCSNMELTCIMLERVRSVSFNKDAKIRVAYSSPVTGKLTYMDLQAIDSEQADGGKA